MTAPVFTHLETGTPESAWLADERWDERPSVDLERLAAAHDEVVVLAAHPDDETVGAGATLAALAALGLRARVIVCTAGEGSHPRSSAWTPERLAVVRRAEVEAAVRELAPDATVEHLGLPDGGLAAEEARLAEIVTARLLPSGSTGQPAPPAAASAEGRAGRILVLAPHVADGHSDHDALGRAALVAAHDSSTGDVRVTVAHYPIWLWHHSGPADLSWGEVSIVEPPASALHAKRRALSHYVSQTHAASEEPGDEPVLGSAAVARSERLFEVLLTVRGAPPAPLEPTGHSTEREERFDAMFDAGDDPWGFEDSFYETRRRDLVLAALGRPAYGHALEIGCSTGQLTRALATRCASVVGIDTSGRALAVAGLQTPEGVTWLHGTAPRDLPHGTFDLIVVSEVGYFLTPTELVATLRAARARLADGGELALVHWQHPTEDIPLDGVLVHEQARHQLDLPVRAVYRDADVCVEVWGAPESVAGAEARR